MPNKYIYLKRFFQSRKLVLASASPRRSQLLRQLGVRFRVKPSRVSERCARSATPRAIACALALKKARAVARMVCDSVILGADTIVVCRGRIIGKPNDERHAVRILGDLSGSIHTVITGVALIDQRTGTTYVRAQSSKVYFRVIPRERRAALARKHLDKAGAYAIQSKHDRFVKRFTGSYSNIVGLPLELLERMTRRLVARSRIS